MLPDYLAKAVPIAEDKRAPWFANTVASSSGVTRATNHEESQLSQPRLHSIHRRRQQS